MKKRLISILLVLSMVLAWVPAQVFASDAVSGTCGYDVYWTLNDGVLTITGDGSISDFKSQAPWYSYREEIVSVIMDDSVGSIGDRAFSDLVNLRSVILSENVYTIGEWAFSGCSSLTEIELPEGLWRIDANAFRYCDSLTSVRIPANVGEIGQAAFHSCAKLGGVWVDAENDKYWSDDSGALLMWDSYNEGKAQLVQVPQTLNGTYTIPSNVISVGYLGCYGCSGLTEIVFPDGLQWIANSSFQDCDGLTEVRLPASLTSFGNSTFVDCDNLRDVYYGGTEEQWLDAIPYGTDCEYDFSGATIHFLGETEEPETPEDPATIDVEFTYVDAQDFYPTLPAVYSDGYFTESAYTFNDDLAWLTLCTVLAGYSAETDSWGEDGGDSSEIAKSRYANIADAYQQMGFTDAEYYKYGTTLNDTTDTVAYSIAKKADVDGGTLVALVVRGGAYGAEWASNFNVGSGSGDHQGFHDAAEAVYTQLLSTVEEIDGDVKLWITGYSRGAAVANMVAAWMDDHAEDSDQLNRERIYTYTFATPQGVTDSKDTGAACYENIFNIVNPGDVVPKVALTDWGFDRYGITKYFNIFAGDDIYSQVAENYAMYTGESYNASGNGKMYLAEHALIDILLNNFPTTASSQKLQKAVHGLMEYLNTKKSVSGSWENISAEEYHETLRARHGKVYDAAYSRAIKGLSESFTGKLLVELVKNQPETLEIVKLFVTVCEINGMGASQVIELVYKVFFQAMLSEENILSGDNVSGLAAEHTPAVYLSWMNTDAGEDKYIAPDSEDFRVGVMEIACPVDVTVYDGDGAPVAQIRNHEVESAEIPVVTSGETTRIYFLKGVDQNHSVKILPTADGAMNYSVTEYDLDRNVVFRANYQDIAIDTTQTYQADIYGTDDTYSDSYDLLCIDEDGSRYISADDVCYEADEVTLSAEIVGEGTITGVGAHLRGETVCLEAYPDYGYIFGGWYMNDVPVSHEDSYHVCMESDLTVTAEFLACSHEWDDGEIVVSPTVDSVGEKSFTCIRCGEIKTEEIPKLPRPNPFIDVQKGKFYYNAVLWAVENGITSGTSKTEFSPDDDCTRGQVVTFLWRAAGKPEPKTTENPFTDVNPKAFYYKAMLWAVENGITAGTSKTTFEPDAKCTRAQVVTFLWRAMNKPAATSDAHNFTDVRSNGFYYKAMLWAVENGITAGTSKTKFSPEDTCTRGQVVTFLYRCFD